MNLEEFLLPYQRRYVNDASRFKVWLAARQVGKSTAVAFEATLLAAAKPRTAVLLVSASQRQSQELLERVRHWMGAIKAGVDREVIRRENMAEVCLANDSRILSLPANPDTIRGFSGHIFLDEFAFHRDSRRIWAAVFPIATRGFDLRITSTPNGRQNMFHDIWNRGGPHWGRHRTTIHEAVTSGLKIDLELLRQSCPDAETWAQEYECQFLDEATAFLTYEMIAAVEHDRAGLPQFALNGPFYFGADVGRRRDLTVFWVLEEVEDVLWTRELVVLNKVSFAEQDAQLDRLMQRYAPRRLCMDQSGLGEKVVEDAQNRYGRSRVEGLLFTAKVKQDLAGTLKRRIEDRTIRLPVDRAVREDLHSVCKVITPAGNIRFDVARAETGHADRFWALALAVHAGSDPGGLPVIISGHTRPSVRNLSGY